MAIFNFLRNAFLPKAPCQVNSLAPGESLQDFHYRIYAKYSNDLKAPAVKMLRETIPEETQQEIRAAIAADPEYWATPYHFWWGMSIRNLLREKGFGEDYWPIWNLDDIYVMLVEDAVRQTPAQEAIGDN
jgi:hypothetical protein